MNNKQAVFLIVDDFEPMRKVTSGQLRSMGAGNIVMANNGAEALRILQNQRVDIVLSDWNMPVMSGLELLKAVRADKALAHLPFVMITAEAERERVEEAIMNGVSDLLVKPYTTDCLAAHVERARKMRPQSISPVLEVLATEHEAPLETEQDVPDLTRQTILAVDDTADNLQLLSQLFKDEYRMRIAQSGEKALAICQSDNPPDLVLLDVMMPGMDGFEVARRMREHPTSETIPVIFVTAMTGADARLKGMGLGAVDFVTKPIDPNVLKPRVRNFMRYVKLHKQLQADYDGMLEAAHLREDVEHITRHDVKGPLAGVIGLVQALADDDSMSRRQIAQLRIIEETALQALNMINLSTELFKIETGRFKLDAKPVNIGDLLHRIVEISRTTFAEKHLIITVDTDEQVGEIMPLVLGDAMLCYSLFQNLVKNACEAAPEKSKVSIILIDETKYLRHLELPLADKIKATTPQVDEIPLHIIIQNMGAVPAEVRERFFDKFVTLGKQGGTGLGTYSAKLLTEAQNGTISLEVSDSENQTTVTVTLPRYSEVLDGIKMV